VGIGASLSRIIAGSLFHRLGPHTAFLFLAAVAAAALAILALFMRETGRPQPPRGI
jgi:predicted MFS family arabinose efflux permease